jgi:hypothetical protein
LLLQKKKKKTHSALRSASKNKTKGGERGTGGLGQTPWIGETPTLRLAMPKAMPNPKGWRNLLKCESWASPLLFLLLQKKKKGGATNRGGDPKDVDSVDTGRPPFRSYPSPQPSMRAVASPCGLLRKPGGREAWFLKLP